MKSVNVHPQKYNSAEILETAHKRVALVREIAAARDEGNIAKVNELRKKLLETK